MDGRRKATRLAVCSGKSTIVLDVRVTCSREGNHHEERAVNDPDEDFAAMFEASLQAKRLERGQTVEGTIVAIGPKVAFVDVGGKGEATIEIGELKDAEGNLE